MQDVERKKKLMGQVESHDSVERISIFNPWGLMEMSKRDRKRKLDKEREIPESRVGGNDFYRLY